ncbi:MAG: hypothetical protein FJ295_18390 [Planctomycetes bacterium]|nr:hypothetical protein [Planctomycetota bacterium]
MRMSLIVSFAALSLSAATLVAQQSVDQEGEPGLDGLPMLRESLPPLPQGDRFGIERNQDFRFDAPRRAVNSPAFDTPSMSTDLYIYLQEQRKAEDPKYIVQRRAALKAEQRERRLAAMKWYGLSNTRPVANSVPVMGSYSPTWVGNSWNAYHWVPVSHAAQTALIIEHHHTRH